jgi:hypothetical protein
VAHYEPPYFFKNTLFKLEHLRYTSFFVRNNMNEDRRGLIKKIGIIIGALVVVAIGVLGAAFFAVRWHWTDVGGIVDTRSAELRSLADRITEVRQDTGPTERTNICKAFMIGEISGSNAQRVVDAYDRTKSGELLSNMVEAIAMHLNERPESLYGEKVNRCDAGIGINRETERSKWNMAAPNVFAWMNTEDWDTFKGATVKDKDVIARVAQETGVEPRLIVAQLVAEQLRLFNSDRAVYKRFFAPLKMLGSETKFSLGVTGVKEETAIKIESNLRDINSPFYLGAQYEHLLDFKKSDIATERYDRITNEHDHYYAYLYTALYLKEIMQQWGGAGFDIAHRPEILSTLFNIGFAHSKPNADPETGGAMIEIAGEKYSFGSLGYEFYYSGEMMDEFPYRR